MSIYALTLVLVSSVFHIGWNSLTKAANDKLAFLWLALIPLSVYGSFNLFWKAGLFFGDSETFLYLLLSGILHIFYFVSLSKAYHVSDLSFVYPNSRAIGAIISSAIGVLVLQEPYNLLGLLGVAVTIFATFFGILESRKKMKKTEVFIILLTGLSIGFYLVIDSLGVKKIGSINYISGMFLIMFLGIAPFVLSEGRAIAEFKRSKGKPFYSSLFMISGYLMVLRAMETTSVSYVVAARSFGIVLSAVSGIIFFNESLSRVKWISIILISIGVFLVGIA